MTNMSIFAAVALSLCVVVAGAPSAKAGTDALRLLAQVSQVTAVPNANAKQTVNNTNTVANNSRNRRR